MHYKYEDRNRIKKIMNLKERENYLKGKNTQRKRKGGEQQNRENEMKTKRNVLKGTRKEKNNLNYKE